MSLSDEKVDELTEAVRTELQKDYSTNMDSVSSRVCSDDNNTGVDVEITGEWIALRNVLELTTEMENWTIESIGMYPHEQKTCSDCETEIGDKSVVIFFVYQSEKSKQLSSLLN